MNGKKLIKKIWIPVLSAFVIGVLGLSFYSVYVDSTYDDYRIKSENYIQKFSEENQLYLDEIAKKIDSFDVSEELVSQLESEYFVHQQIESKNKKYLWLESKDEKFVFGVPEVAFNVLNSGYDKYEDVIKTDNIFTSRNNFLTKLIDNYKDIDFSEWSTNTSRYGYRWRNFINSRYDNHSGIVLKKAVFDKKQKIIGTLYLKVSDLENNKYYYSKREYGYSTFYDDILPIFIIFTVLSSLFIWFLMPTWVYIDAQQRGVQNPLTWAILTLISLVFGLVIYLITRPSTIKTLNCPHCENELNGTRAFCPHCGYDLTSTFCQQCEYPVKPGWKFCPSCRTEIKSNVQRLPETKEFPVEDIEPENTN